MNIYVQSLNKTVNKIKQHIKITILHDIYSHFIVLFLIHYYF